MDKEPNFILHMSKKSRTFGGRKVRETPEPKVKFKSYGVY